MAGPKKARAIEMNPPANESSAIEALGHDPESDTLRVRFRSGGTYDYAGVSAEKAQALAESDSAGKHFHLHVRDKHDAVKVEE